MRPRSALVGAGLAVIVAGSALTAGAVVTGVRAPAAGPAAGYVAPAACSDCPAGVSLDSVEVQARQGSTLFVVRGRWPASVDTLPDALRLTANDLDVVLQPHGSGGVFEMASATRGGAAVAGASIVAGLSQGAMVIDVSPALTPPVTFAVGLWSGTGATGSYHGRIPRSGELVWSGSGPPTLGTATVTPTPSPTPTTGPDLTGAGGACPAIPSTGSIPPYLEVSSPTSLAPSDDPRLHVPRRSVAITLGGSILDVTAAYAVVAVVTHAGESPASGMSRPIDRAGAEQLLLTFDGATKHKVIRALSGGVWTAQSDAAADALTFVVQATGVTMFWADLRAGDRYGFITAGGGECRAIGLDASLQPQLIAN